MTIIVSNMIAFFFARRLKSSSDGNIHDELLPLLPELKTSVADFGMIILNCVKVVIVGFFAAAAAAAAAAVVVLRGSRCCCCYCCQCWLIG